MTRSRNAPVSDSKGKPEAPRVPVNSEADELLLQYIDAAHSRPIIEAMDMDGSGYISVKELNQGAEVRFCVSALHNCSYQYLLQLVAMDGILGGRYALIY